MPLDAMTSEFVAALDVGTTTVRCFIINNKGHVVGAAHELVDLLNPQPGYFEIEPEALWRKIKLVIKAAIKDAKLKPSHISCLGISTQRCTFLTWNHRTQHYFHNFITWKDLRAQNEVEKWNNGLMRRSINLFSHLLYLLTRNKRFQAGSVIKAMNAQVTLRLLHEIKNNPELQKALKDGTARVELLDSWLLYKLRSGNGKNSDVEHVTDISSATATGLYDPFTLAWSPMSQYVFGIDTRLLPKVVDNAYPHLGNIHAAAFCEVDALEAADDGKEWQHAQIPIMASVSDQTAALWGCGCFAEGDSKLTLGTGAFLNLITGNECQASLLGMYPLVAFQLPSSAKNTSSLRTTYCMEGSASDMGTIVSWAEACGIIENVEESATQALTVKSTNGVYFVPAFSGLGPPVNDPSATSGFIGITPSTERAHLVRALLEGIAYRVIQMCDTVEQETSHKLQVLKVNGGVSRNDFICQLLADATGIPVERSENHECSALGAAFLAGINQGIWNLFNDSDKFARIGRRFTPNKANQSLVRQNMAQWQQAMERFTKWY